MLSDIRAILFDLGGTLVDYPLPGWRTIASRCLRGVYGYLVDPEGRLPAPVVDLPEPEEAGAHRSPAGPETALGHRVTIGIRRIIRGASGHTLPRIAEACARPLVASGRVYDDTFPALDALKARGIPMVIVSNTPWGTPDYLWEQQLRRFGLADYFLAALFSSGVGFQKPDRRIFEAALRRAGASAGQALFVGDHPHYDIEGAHRAGLRTALVMRGAWTQESEDAPADLRIRKLTDLLAALPGQEAVP